MLIWAARAPVKEAVDGENDQSQDQKVQQRLCEQALQQDDRCSMAS